MFIHFFQDLLSGKYYKDKEEMREKQIEAKKAKEEKSLQKPLLPPK